MREAASDFFYNSWRLVPANALWGVMLVALMIGTAVWLPLAALACLLALPVAGMHRMAALLQRGEPAGFSDFLHGMRRFAAPALALGVASVVLAAVFTANVFIGLDAGGVVGWSLSAFALYGDVGLAMFLVAAWPILVDPLREDVGVSDRLKLAALVNLARPGRMLALTLVIVVLLTVSVFLFAALLTVSIAYVSLVGTRYVLPAADRLEGRRTKIRAQ